MTQPRLDADPEAPGPLIPQKPLCAAREPKELMFNCPNIVNRVCQACQLVSVSHIPLSCRLLGAYGRVCNPESVPNAAEYEIYFTWSWLMYYY